MTWKAPAVVEPTLDYNAADREALENWLDFHRTVLLHKCEGLTAEQLCSRPIATSAMSLLGIVRHMSDVERWWFRMALCGEALDYLYGTDDDEDGDWDNIDHANAEADFERFHAEVAAATAAGASKSLDDSFETKYRPERTYNARWVYIHMIEEYARHNGHADLLRELVDGVTDR